MLLEIIVAILFTALALSSILPTFERSLHFGTKIKALPKDELLTPACKAVHIRHPYVLKECTYTNIKPSQLIITRNDAGLSLIEILVSIVLAIILLTVLGKTYAAVSQHSKTLRDWNRADYATDRLEAEITRLFQASDSHTLPIAPKLHSAGEILLRDGSRNEIMSASIKLKPSNQSVALTNCQIASTLLSDITNCNASGSSRSGQACLRYSNNASTNDYQSFILISLDGIYEGQGQLKGQTRCKDFNIILAESILFDSPSSQSSCNELLLIPLDYIQTIYQSNAGDFRLLSHRTNKNVENQPISLINPSLQLLLSFDSTISPWTLKLSINKDNKLLINKQIISKLDRQLTANFLFNFL